MMQQLFAARVASCLGLIVLLGLAGGCEKPDRFMTDPDARDGDARADQAQEDDGFKLFDFSPEPINASKVVIVRSMGGGASVLDRQGALARPENGQLMTINLFNGSFVFEDADGQRYPNVLDSSVASELRQRINSRQWASAPRAGRAGPQNYVYTMQVYTADGQPVKNIASWVGDGVSRQPLFENLTHLFTRQHRRAHPLSDRVDILQN